MATKEEKEVFKKVLGEALGNFILNLGGMGLLTQTHKEEVEAPKKEVEAPKVEVPSVEVPAKRTKRKSTRKRATEESKGETATEMVERNALRESTPMRTKPMTAKEILDGQGGAIENIEVPEMTVPVAPKTTAPLTPKPVAKKEGFSLAIMQYLEDQGVTEEELKENIVAGGADMQVFNTTSVSVQKKFVELIAANKGE